MLNIEKVFAISGVSITEALLYTDNNLMPEIYTLSKSSHDIFLSTLVNHSQTISQTGQPNPKSLKILFIAK